MILVWLKASVKWILRIFVPPPPGYQKPIKKVDPDAKCPSCGCGPLTVETVVVSANPNRPSAMRKAMLQHTCTFCKGFFYTNTLMGDDADKLHGREVSGI